MKIIDLSMPLYSNMEVYQNDPEVKIEKVHSYEEDGWELRKITMGSHTGTHVDAFSHMHPGQLNLDQIPLNRFLGKAQLVQLNESWPKGLGLLLKENIGIEYFEKILASQPHFVGGNLSEDLERALLDKEIITYTNLINLELLPENQTFLFIGLPLRIKDGDGSPVRAIAIIHN